jgi:hypothetical protein
MPLLGTAAMVERDLPCPVMLLDGCAAVAPFGRERIGKRQCLHTTSSYVVDFLKHGPKPKETRSMFFFCKYSWTQTAQRESFIGSNNRDFSRNARTP